MNISDLLCDLYDIREMSELCGFCKLPKDNDGTSTTIADCIVNCITQLEIEQERRVLQEDSQISVTRILSLIP